MPDPKPTAQQQVDDLLYHNRNITLRGMALANWIREYFDESINPPSGEYPLGICYGGDTVRNFVAVGPVTSVALQRSPQGSFWQVMQPGKKLGPFAGVLRDVCYGNLNYCAVGDAEEIQTAPEALPSKWDQRRTAGANTLYGVCYGEPAGSPLLVAVGAGGTILTSDDDGVTWVARTAAGGYVGNFRRVKWTGIRFVAVGDGAEIQTSVDGINWVEQVPYGANVNDFLDVTVGIDKDGDVLVMAVGSPVAGDVPIVQTSDQYGATWVEKTPQTSRTTNGSFSAIAYAEDIYVAASANGEVQVSYDYGETWIFQGACHLAANALAYGTGVFVMCIADNKTFSGVPYGLVLKTLKPA